MNFKLLNNGGYADIDLSKCIGKTFTNCRVSDAGGLGFITKEALFEAGAVGNITGRDLAFWIGQELKEQKYPAEYYVKILHSPYATIDGVEEIAFTLAECDCISACGAIAITADVLRDKGFKDACGAPYPFTDQDVQYYHYGDQIQYSEVPKYSFKIDAPAPIPTFKAGSPVTDAVNHPAHYTQGKYEVIDVIEDATKHLSGIKAVCLANILKYVLRFQYKNGLQDLQKAKWYLEKLMKEVEKDEKN